MIPYLVALLCAALVALMLLGRWARHRRAALGVTDATIVAADDTRRAASTLKSRRLGLVGRPDHLLRCNGVLIPVEHKPSARKLHALHILQVAAHCLLIEGIYKVRPAYAVVVLAGGVQERVAFTPALELHLQHLHVFG